MRSSRVIEETVIEGLPSGLTLFYGTKGQTIRLTIKGSYTPAKQLEKGEPKSTYIEMSQKADMAANKAVHKYIFNNPELQNHAIVETDLTERGLAFGKAAKWRVTVYIRPADPTADKQKLAESIFFEIFFSVRNALEANGFHISEEAVKGRWG